MASPDHESEEFLERLRLGNQRFVDRLDREESQRAALTSVQTPYAAILACSDSRAPLEWMFDVGLGEVFVVRVAGNVASQTSLESIEYAVAVLGVRLVIVLGHENCGAVTAAVHGTGADHVHIKHLLSFIQPAIEAPGDPSIDAVARRNVHLNAERLLSRSEILQVAAESDGLRIVTGFFHLTTGVVEFD